VTRGSGAAWPVAWAAMVLCGCRGDADAPAAGRETAQTTPAIAAPPADGWRARVAANASPLEALLDTSPGWAALQAERPFEAATQFRGSLTAGAAPDAPVRLGAARAFTAAAESLERAADVLLLAQGRMLGGAAGGGEAADWHAFLTTPDAGARETSKTPLPATPLMAFRRAALAALRSPATPDAEAAAAPLCEAEGEDTDALRRRLVACALAGRSDRALAVADRLSFEAPAVQLAPPPPSGDAGLAPPTPLVDPLPALALARILRTEARAAVCSDAAGAAPFAFACAQAESGLGRTDAARTAITRALAEANWSPEAFFPLLVFGNEDTPAELRRTAESALDTGRAPPPASDPDTQSAWRRGCLMRPPAIPCDADFDRAAEERHLDGVRRALAAWVEQQPEAARALLRDLDVAEARGRARAHLGATVFLKAGKVVEAFALSTAGGPPRMTAEGPARPPQTAALATLALAAVATDNAQLAFDACGSLAGHHPAWAGARDAVRLFGLSLLARGATGAVGGAKPE
jgi:hypothetical protein